VAFFDRRMLRVAERHLVGALEEAKLRRDGKRLAGISDDLKYVAELREDFCKQRGPLLPCLLARFAQPGDPCLEECRVWWEGLRDDDSLTWN
jgi:hypothetical protein